MRLVLTTDRVICFKIDISHFFARSQICLWREDLDFFEPVRYIHLNPLRARLVKDLKALDSYPYSGHSVLMGKRKCQFLGTSLNNSIDINACCC